MVIILKSLLVGFFYLCLKVITYTYIIIQLISGLDAYYNIVKPYRNKEAQIAYHPVSLEILNSNYKLAEILSACYSNMVFNKMYFFVSKKKYNTYVLIYILWVYIRGFILYMFGINYLFWNLLLLVMNIKKTDDVFIILLSKVGNPMDSRKLIFLGGEWLKNPNGYNVLMQLIAKMGSIESTKLFKKLNIHANVLHTKKPTTTEQTLFTDEYFNTYGIKPVNKIHWTIGGFTQSPDQAAYSTDLKTAEYKGLYPETEKIINKFEGFSKTSTLLSIPVQRLIIKNSSISYMIYDRVLNGAAKDGFNKELVAQHLIPDIEARGVALLFLKQHLSSYLSEEDLRAAVQYISDEGLSKIFPLIP